MTAPAEAQPTPVRRIYDVETASQHAQRNIIKSTAETLRGRKCGDGRDSQNIVEAIFGSDLGYAFAAQAALRDMGKLQKAQEKDAIRTTLGIVAGDGQTYVHTDSHHGNEKTIMGGCGANGVARRNMDAFGLTQDDFTALDETMDELQQRGKVERAVYEGDHIEGAVLAVHGKDYGIKAMDKVNMTSVFVLQLDLIRDRFADIAKKLAPQYGISEEVLLAKMMERWQNHTGIIGKELAHLPDGTPLPQYAVVFDAQGKPTVSKT